MDHLADAGFGPFKIRVVVTRHNVDQLDEFKALADSYGAQLRVTRLRPSGRGADSWHDLHPTNDQQRQIYHWLLANGENVLTGDSFFHLNALGEPLPGLNMCGAGRVVCLIDPIGDVYACPFVIHDEFKAGSVRDAGGFAEVWKHSELFLELREPQSAGACASLRQLRRLPGRVHGGQVLHRPAARRPRPRVRQRPRRARCSPASTPAPRPKPAMDHSKPARATAPSAFRSPSAVAEREPCRDGSARAVVAAVRARHVPERDPRSPAANGVDIATFGSGNPGASNVTRALGWRKGGVVSTRSTRSKGALAAGARPVDRRAPAGLRVRRGGDPRPHVPGRPAAFRGGKGVATGGRACCSCCYPIVAPLSLAVWLVGVEADRQGGRSARWSPSSLVPIGAARSTARRRGSSPPIAGVCALIVLSSTPANIKRLIRREEHSLEQDVSEIRAMQTARPARARAAHGAEPDHVRPPRHQPRRRRPRASPPATSPTTSGGRAAGAARSSIEGRQRPRSRLAVRAGAAGRARAARAGRAIADACHAARRAGHRLARPRRRPGLVGLQPARRCGRRRACPRCNSREVPKWMEADDIAAVVAGFARGGRSWPSTPDCDGVEINAGQHSLVRQFLSAG